MVLAITLPTAAAVTFPAFLVVSPVSAIISPKADLLLVVFVIIFGSNFMKIKAANIKPAAVASAGNVVLLYLGLLETGRTVGGGQYVPLWPSLSGIAILVSNCLVKQNISDTARCQRETTH